MQLLHVSVVYGLGIAYAPVWLFEKELQSGEVEPLLLSEMGPAVPIHCVYPAKRLLAKALLFTDRNQYPVWHMVT